MSDEPENLIEEIFIRKIGAKYPFVRSDGVNEKYGIKFFPSVFCITPDGKVLTVPDDRMPAEALIEEQLKNVSLAPKLPADSRYDNLRAFWQKKEMKKLSDFLEKTLVAPNLDEEMKRVYTEQKAIVQQRIERTQARIVDLGKGPDFLDSEATLQKIAREWKGLPPGDAATAELARFAKDAKVQKELGAGKALAKILESPRGTSSTAKRKFLDDLEKFAKKWSGTGAAAKADKLRSDLLVSGD